jgi:hypothetical protein
MGLAERSREEERKERKIASNYEEHHICVGPRHKKTH